MNIIILILSIVIIGLVLFDAYRMYKSNKKNDDFKSLIPYAILLLWIAVWIVTVLGEV